MGNFRVILITCATEQEAGSIAHALVEERLAACVNILPGIRSIYTWKNKIQEEAEVLLIAKSSKAKLGQFEKRLNELHSYDTPEFVVLDPEHISEKYQDWLAQVLR